MRVATNREETPMHVLLILALVVGMLPPTGVSPPTTQTIQIDNDSSLPMDEIQIRPKGTRAWSANLLAGPIRPITIGSYQINLMSSICVYDVQFVLHDGTTSQVFGVNLCQELPIIEWYESTTGED
jgi:hypothetical protein